MDYASLRKLTDASATVNRVEVNQRALIDKILARYATASAVYRELLQNSNDANATVSEIDFTIKDGIVESVTYRNNGFPFREQDWDRLRKIAEGNPDASKVGAFGVGAYSMFSITEEPIVVSGDSCLLFCWKGDALYTRTAKNEKPDEWTTFILPSRDPYPTPDFNDFGEFLASSLTFTKALKCIRVTLNGVEKLSIVKTLLVPPRPVKPPPASTKAVSFLWESMGSSAFQSSCGMFTLARDNIEESVVRLTVQVDSTDAAYMDARYVIANVPTRISAQQQKRMHRVTKKDPPKHVPVQLFLNYNHTAAQRLSGTSKLPLRLAQSFAPTMGKGKIFIGFRTSQTTGLAAHVAAPFLPTVEREAMDLQDPALAKFNKDLLEISGMLMRLTLEHSMRVIDAAWHAGAQDREALEAKLIQEAQPVQETEAEIAPENDEEEDGQSGIMGFARFMARGVKKKIVAAAKTILEGDGTEHLLHPPDPRPLSPEEEQAVILMSSFCPQMSTPDHIVGAVIASGFSNCLPKVSPPVLTKSGVLPGDQARLPHYGIEGFVSDNVIRSIVFQNAEEYHTLVVECRKLTVEDLLAVVAKTTYTQEMAVRLVRWWRRFSHVESRARQWGPRLKDSIRFHWKENESIEVKAMSDYLFYVGDNDHSLISKLPLPDTVLPLHLQEEIGRSVLTNETMVDWFSPLPFEVFAQFICHHKAMTAGVPEDETLRIQILNVLCQEYTRRIVPDRTVFGGLCCSLLNDKRCIPFDSELPSAFAAGVPSELYLYTAELKAFDGIGSFHKVSTTLKSAGISEDFLLALGVRKSVSVDFLFANLETLSWSQDPKSLVEYLRSATLTSRDISKLATTRYLPAHDDPSKTYAPSELYLPNEALSIFPFVKRLQWPSEPEVSEKSDNGRFLKRLGMMTMPPLSSVMAFVCGATLTDDARVRGLDFLSERLNPHHGVYFKEYNAMSFSARKSYRCLPCVATDPMGSNSVSKMCSPLECYSDDECSAMGFAVLNKELLGQRIKLYGNLFQVLNEPQSHTLLKQLSETVATAKTRLLNAPAEEKGDVAALVHKSFEAIFGYLSQRSSSLNSSTEFLKKDSFIPILRDHKVVWYRPDEVFFKRRDGEKDLLTEELFHVIEYNQFLSVCGVKETATTREIFQRVLQAPEKVLELLGSESKYRSLLRRIAADPPFPSSRIPQQVRRCRFLLGYSVAPVVSRDEEDQAAAAEEKTTYKLASAEDIFVVDNSNFARMFPVLRAPPETDLEDFYAMLGSKFISKSVERRYEVFGSPVSNTSLTRSFQGRLKERGPLLVSPMVTSRPLAFGAASIINDDKLDFYEATNLLVVYSLGKESRRTRTTCFSRPEGRGKNAFFMTSDFDFFDAGQAVGDLILQRCQLEDAFFISSLLEAPLEQLRARGFPVDRILKPEPPPKPLPAPVQEIQEDHVLDRGTDTGENVRTKSNGAEEDRAEARNPNSTSSESSSELDGSKADILKSMFPDADADFIKAALGNNPSMDQLQSLAQEMSAGNYPTKDASENSTVATEQDEPSTNHESAPNPKKKSIRKRLGKAFNGIKGSNFGGMQLPPPSIGGSNFTNDMPTPPSSKAAEHREPVAPATDASTQSSLERMLEQSVNTATKVDANGIESPETQLTSIPPDLDKGDTCEALPPQSLKPFLGPLGTGKSHNGMRLFSSRQFAMSENFMRENEVSLKSFADVLHSLCIGVFGLKAPSLAIYHDPAGATIAFNRGKALHFNLRFFHALHFLANKQETRECYSYWFIVICHELAHNLVHGHNKEHGFYTESFAMKYLPQFSSVLRSLPE